MSKIKILIVEDELIIAEDIRSELGDLGYEVAAIATSYEEALDMLRDHQPDVMLIDIVLSGDKDGIELAGAIREIAELPLIFLTSHSDAGTVERAKQVRPDAYIVKPFEKADLYTAIEIAFSNYADKIHPAEKEPENEKSNYILKDSIFIKKDYILIKVRFNEIKWLKSEGNYIELHCPDKQHLVRSSLRDFLDKLPSFTFIQTHKSFAINVNHIDSINHANINIGKDVIPIGRTFLDPIKKLLKLDL
jgi:two-component system response regulator LytT